MDKIRNFLETQFFGVCEKLGEKLGVSKAAIRLFFIYTSFLALGSPIILYFMLLFIIDIRKHLRKKRSFYYDI